MELRLLVAALFNTALGWAWYGPFFFHRFWLMSRDSAWSDIVAQGFGPWLSLLALWLLSAGGFALACTLAGSQLCLAKTATRAGRRPDGCPASGGLAAHFRRAEAGWLVGRGALLDARFSGDGVGRWGKEAALGLRASLYGCSFMATPQNRPNLSLRK